MKFLKRVNLKKFFLHNFWLKLIALIVAVIVWYMMKGDITRGVPT